ncbi:MAG: hypothetical protein HYW85_06815 [Deltaproteobacteria bacterium]|nr:hypothetical protein [Deltaproteobacteria bacterium]
MKTKQVFILSLLLTSILIQVAGAEEFKIRKNRPVIKNIPSAHYQWGVFQDVEILTGNSQRPVVLFALRKGVNPNPPGDRTVGLWHGYKDSQGQWHSRGIQILLTQYMKDHFNLTPPPVANQTDNLMTACKDYNGKYHIFTSIPERIAPPSSRLLYVLWEQDGRYKIKISNPLSDPTLHSMKCFADRQQNVHLFGRQTLTEIGYSPLVAYTINAQEQRNSQNTFNYSRIALPNSIQPSAFTIYKSHQALNILYNNKHEAVLSLAQKSTRVRGVANLESGWNVLNANINPDGNANQIDEIKGFGIENESYVFGRRHSVYTQTNSDLPPNGVVYYHAKPARTVMGTITTWKNKGLIFRQDLVSLSVAAEAPRISPHLAGITPQGEIWAGFMDHGQTWKNQGVIFRANSH